MLKPVRTVAPAVTPVSLVEAKAQLRVDTSDDDTLITALIDAATEHLDGYTGMLGRALITQTWRQQLPRFPSRGETIGLEVGPVQSIASIAYFDADNVQQVLAASVYVLLEDESGPLVMLQVNQSWPATFAREDAVTVTYVAGYGDTGSDVPAGIRQAMLLLIGAWYENREQTVIGVSVTDLPMPVGIDALLTNHRRWL